LFFGTIENAVKTHISTAISTLALDVADSASFNGFAGQVKSVLQSRWQRERFDFLVNNAGFG